MPVRIYAVSFTRSSSGYTRRMARFPENKKYARRRACLAVPHARLISPNAILDGGWDGMLRLSDIHHGISSRSGGERQTQRT